MGKKGEEWHSRAGEQRGVNYPYSTEHKIGLCVWNLHTWVGWGWEEWVQGQRNGQEPDWKGPLGAALRDLSIILKVTGGSDCPTQGVT